jgi:hypothetical protein
MGNESSQRRNRQGSTFSRNRHFTQDPHVPLSQGKFDNFSPSTRRDSQQGSKFSGNSQSIPETDVPPPMPQTSRSRFPELVGLTVAEAKGRVVQMGKRKEICCSLSI